MAEIRLPELETIKRFSIAVRSEHADVDEVIDALRTDLQALLQATGRLKAKDEPSPRASASAPAKKPAAKVAAKAPAVKLAAAKKPPAKKPVARTPARRSGTTRRGR